MSETLWSPERLLIRLSFRKDHDDCGMEIGLEGSQGDGT